MRKSEQGVEWIGIEVETHFEKTVAFSFPLPNVPQDAAAGD